MINIILICGKNNALSNDKLDEILKERKKFFNEDFVAYDAGQKQFDFYTLKNELSSESMFFKKRVVVLRNAFSNLSFKKDFIGQKEFLQKKDGLIIFFEEADVTKTEAFFKFIKKTGRIYEFKEMDDAGMSEFLEKNIVQAHFKMNLAAMAALMSAVNGDSWRLKHELSKLMAFKAKEKNIDKNDVEKLVKPDIENDIFKTIEAIAKKDKKQSFELIHEHMEKGDVAPYIFSMIAFQFRNMLIVKDRLEKSPYLSAIELRGELKGMHPFVIQKSVWLSKTFTLAQLQKIYRKIFQMDLAVKNGKFRPEEALEMFLFDI